MPGSFENVFEAIETDKAVAQNLFIRGKLMMRLKEYIAASKTNGYFSQTQARGTIHIP